MQQNRPVIIGIVGHLSPSFIDSFENYLREYPEFRVIKITVSDKKLWIMEQEE